MRAFSFFVFFVAVVKLTIVPSTAGAFVLGETTAKTASEVAGLSKPHHCFDTFFRDASGQEKTREESANSISVIAGRPENNRKTTADFSAAVPALTLPLLLLFTIGSVSISSTAVFALEGDISRGADLFNNNCASCHVGGANVIKPGKTLQLKDLEKNLKSADQETIQTFFQNSMQHKLLNFPKVEGGKLSEQQVVDVTTYIFDQATGNKW